MHIWSRTLIVFQSALLVALCQHIIFKLLIFLTIMNNEWGSFKKFGLGRQLRSSVKQYQCVVYFLVYFDQHLGAAHSNSWSEYIFPCFFRVLERSTQLQHYHPALLSAPERPPKICTVWHLMSLFANRLMPFALPNLNTGLGKYSINLHFSIL